MATYYPSDLGLFARPCTGPSCRVCTVEGGPRCERCGGEDAAPVDGERLCD
jgi:hypothetical protein